MASNKSKQKTSIWLKVFARNHNSRSENGKRTTVEGEEAMTKNGYKSDVYADDFGDNQGGTKKTVMWCLIAVLISIGILVYYHHGKKGASEDIAKTEVLDLDTTSVSVVQVTQVPQPQVQEKKKQPVQQPVQQKVVTVSKQQVAPAPEPEKPTKTESKAEPEYAPNGEILIQKPVYPKNGFSSNKEKENYFSTLEEYRKQQRRISDWKIQHDIE